ncbi:hypothetical protein FH972_006093 [Carpinus fangiana]|uniref:Uncharacterized protein n=1 Tax=Carpinus fangiana TaxID=176857 RepID=A0A5N6QUH3_9ROSI|nr:hypothetical protein FH972_006093 [Carpinus fangiana]
MTILPLLLSFVDNGVASKKLTPERVENSKELCTAPATSENTLIAGDAVSPRKGETAPLATPSAEGIFTVPKREEGEVEEPLGTVCRLPNQRTARHVDFRVGLTRHGA